LNGQRRNTGLFPFDKLSVRMTMFLLELHSLCKVFYRFVVQLLYPAGDTK
jgi:hypothetical protein